MAGLLAILQASGAGPAVTRVASAGFLALCIGLSKEGCHQREYSTGAGVHQRGDGTSERKPPQIPAAGSPLQNTPREEINMDKADAAGRREALQRSLRPVAAAGA